MKTTIRLLATDPELVAAPILTLARYPAIAGAPSTVQPGAGLHAARSGRANQRGPLPNTNILNLSSGTVAGRVAFDNADPVRRGASSATCSGRSPSNPVV
jgi:hypothetical protein